MRLIISAGVWLLASLLMAGCQQPLDDTHLSSGAALTKNELTMAQNGNTVTLKVGQSVALALPGAPQTGYVWEVQQAPGALVQKQASRFDPAPDPDGCGMQHLQFAARQEGSGELMLAYRATKDASANDEGEEAANYYTLHLKVIR